MKQLLILALAGVVLTLASGIAFVRIPPSAAANPTAIVLQELFKAALTLSLVTVGGAALKGAVDGLLEDQRARRLWDQQQADRRDSIIQEFVEIYSNFYSVRKLYHSAFSEKNSVYVRATDDYSQLIRKLLKRSVDLEGRFGALKVLATTFFQLPVGDFATKDTAALKLELNSATDPRQIARFRLDLLGEAYDDWRHALEQERKISMSSELWENYEKLLHHFLEGSAVR